MTFYESDAMDKASCGRCQYTLINIVRIFKSKRKGTNTLYHSIT